MLTVTVCDPAPGSQATHASAGMLAPVTEAHYGEDRLLGLNRSRPPSPWPAFAAELEAESGRPVGYRTCGSLLVALDADDARVLDDLAAYLDRLGLDAEPHRLPGPGGRARAGPRRAPGLRVLGDHQADNRLLADALLAALAGRGIDVVHQAVRRIVVDDGAVAGVALDDDTVLAADRVLLAAGAWSAGIEGVPADARPRCGR